MIRTTLSFAAVAVSLALAKPALAQSCPTSRDVIRVDHRTGTVTYRGSEIPRTRTIRVPSGEPVYVCVDRTNTAAYNYAVDASAVVPSPDAQALVGFLAAGGPYLTAVLTELSSPPDLTPLQTLASLGDSLRFDFGDAGTPAITPEDAAENLEDALDALDTEVAAALGQPQRELVRALDVALGILREARAVEIGALETVSAMRERPDDAVRLGQSFRSAHASHVTCRSQPSGRARASAPVREICSFRGHDALLEAFEAMGEALPIAKEALGTIAVSPGVAARTRDVTAAVKVLAEATGRDPKTILFADPVAAARGRVQEVEGVLGKRDAALATLASLERVATALSTARTSWETDTPFRVDVREGREATVTIAPSATAALARAAVYDPVTVKVRATPDWLIRPSVGLSLVHAPRAVYSDYEAVEVGSDVLVSDIAEVNRTFTYTLDLALTTRGLDRRDHGGVTWWPLVLSLNPSDEVRAVGIGTGLSASLFRVGLGLLWTRNEQLPDGVEVGDTVTASSLFRTQEAYFEDPARVYFSIAITGWPPFMSSSD